MVKGRTVPARDIAVIERRKKARRLLAGAAAILVGSVAADVLLLDVPVLAERMPEWSATHMLRTLMAFLASALLVVGLAMLPSATGPSSWSRWGEVIWTKPGAGGRPLWRATVQELIVWLAYAQAGAFVLLFLWRPRAFYTLSREGRPVETLSALLAFAAAAAFAYAAARLLRGGQYRTHGICALALAATSFLIGMEEVSWFQRVLDLETPAVLDANQQGELNLHNLATDKIELAYYGATFLLLALLPFAAPRIPALHRRLGPLTPGPMVAVVAAASTAFTVDQWNIVFLQVALFVSVGITVVLTWHPGRALVSKAIPPVLLAFQAVFLTGADRFVRDWDVTEYREYLIPLALLVYAAEVATSPLAGSAEIAREDRSPQEERGPALTSEGRESGAR
jgi:hypothetical protein